MIVADPPILFSLHKVEAKVLSKSSTTSPNPLQDVPLWLHKSPSSRPLVCTLHDSVGRRGTSHCATGLGNRLRHHQWVRDQLPQYPLRRTPVRCRHSFFIPCNTSRLIPFLSAGLETCGCASQSPLTPTMAQSTPPKSGRNASSKYLPCAWTCLLRCSATSSPPSRLLPPKIPSLKARTVRRRGSTVTFVFN